MIGRIQAIAGLLVRELLRKKDFYVCLVLTGLILFFAAQLRFYGISTASRYLLDIGLALVFFFGAFLTVSLAARQYPGDLRDKTLHVLLARPVSRFEYLAGKILGAWAAGAVASAVFFTALMVAIFSKTTDISWGLALEAYFVFSLALGILSSLSVLASLVMTTTSAVSLVLSAYGLISVYGFYWSRKAAELPALSRAVSLALYFSVPHFEFFDFRQRLVHGWPAPPPEILAFLMMYSFFYIALFCAVAKTVLSRKSIS